MDKNISNKPVVSAVTKDNWGGKLSKLKSQYPSIKDLNLEFKSGNGNEFIDGVYNQVGKTIGKTKEEFLTTINSL